VGPSDTGGAPNGKVFQRNQRKEPASEQFGLVQFIRPIGGVHQIRGNEGNNPASQYHEHPVYTKDGGEECAKQTECRTNYDQNAFCLYPSNMAWFLRGLQCPEVDFKLKNNSFQNGAEQAHTGGSAFNIVLVRIEAMVLQMTKPVGMPAAKADEFQHGEKDFIEQLG